MLTAQDICERLDLDLNTVAGMHARRILPEPIRVGGDCRWREEDFDLFVDYLRDRRDCRERGVDPDSPDGPSVPVYSTAGGHRFDPRVAAAEERERERQQRSRTLAAGTKPIEPQQHVEMPDAAQPHAARTKNGA